ncbi:hypothetical protein BT93_H1639 [Corymbia citriodora subsp. variegata]|nr:hypothetical protein BT93_H1639 [Corymbia citriodora subsp. variegata]
MNPSLPTCSRRSRRRRRKRGGEGGSPPPTPPQQHQNPHAGASTPALLMRPQDHHHHPPRQHQQHSALRNIERLERIDRAVAKAWPDLVAAGESVSSWKVSQAVVLALQVDSWSSMGFSMQQINAFIPCFVETQKITSLYDMQKAVCKNGGIEQFEELELGPFLRYPLSGKRKSRKPFEIGDLLSFISKEKSVSGMEKLGVRIRNLGCVFFVFNLFS